ncbi:MAG: O-antigen ligase domain-containing protein [Bacteroidetes bacterium]|nr:MAG: O-antigen ligase domain-containing protein [Bacteroidota bacterium]
MAKAELKKTGKGLIVFLMVVMILRITSYFTVHDSAAVTQVFKTFLRVLLTGCCFLLYRYLDGQSRPVQFTYKNVPSLFLYCMYLFLGFASLLWTSDLRYSSLQLAMDVECVFFVFYYWKLVLVLNTHDRFVRKTDMARILALSIALISIAFLIGMFANPAKFYRGTHGGEVQRLGGFIINPNELGMLSVVGAASIYVEWKRKGINFWTLLGWAMMVWCLVATESRSSMISFFLTTFLFVMLSGKPRLIFATFAAGFAVMPIIFQKIFVKAGDVEEVMNMTGRIPFWHDLIVYGFPREPLLGYGFMRISYHDKFDSIHAYAAGMTHNTFIQVLINLGMVGTLIVLLQMIFTVRAYLREQDLHKKYFCLGVFIPIFVNSLTEFGIWGETNYGIMFWLIIIYMLVLDARPYHEKISYD